MFLLGMYIGGWICTGFFLWVIKLEATKTEALFNALVWAFMIPYLLFKGSKQ